MDARRWPHNQQTRRAAAAAAAAAARAAREQAGRRADQLRAREQGTTQQLDRTVTPPPAPPYTHTRIISQGRKGAAPRTAPGGGARPAAPRPLSGTGSLALGSVPAGGGTD